MPFPWKLFLKHSFPPVFSFETDYLEKNIVAEKF